jgi:hypothetical protein
MTDVPGGLPSDDPLPGRKAVVNEARGSLTASAAPRNVADIVNNPRRICYGVSAELVLWH